MKTKNRHDISPEELGEALLSLVTPDGKKAVGRKHTASGSPATTGFNHGPGGLLTWPGVDPDVYSTMIGTLPGIMNQIPTMPSVFMNPTYQILTGVKADPDQAEPDGICDDAIVGGLLKGGLQTAPFGRYQRATREVSIHRLGQRVDRADPVDLRMVGNLQGSTPFGDAGQMAGLGPVGTDMLVNEMVRVYYERAVSMYRLLARQVWQGNPANTPNPDGNAHTVEMVGLDLLINTGHVDAVSNTSLPSLDADVKNFNYLDVAANGDALVNALTYMARYVRVIAERSGVMPVRWAFVMRETAFYEITAVWPCSYMTAMCNFNDPDSTRLNLNSSDLISMRDQMRTEQYLLIDGRRYDVILDDGIAEDTNTTNANVPSGSFASDIYLVPFSVMNGRSVLYFEYFQWQNPSINTALNSGLLLARAMGPWLETVSQKNWCFKFQAMIEPRLVLRTPWLAGRLTNVVYSPLQHTRDPFPDDPYFVNGGDTERPGPSYYTPW